MSNTHPTLTDDDLIALLEKVEAQHGYSRKIVELEQRLGRRDWPVCLDIECLTAEEREALAHAAYELGLSRGRR